jgi:hypothetical protein
MLLEDFPGFSRVPESLRRHLKWIFAGLAAVLLGSVLLWLADRLFLLSVSRSYVDEIRAAFDCQRTDLSPANLCLDHETVTQAAERLPKTWRIPSPLPRQNLIERGVGAYCDETLLRA